MGFEEGDTQSGTAFQTLFATSPLLTMFLGLLPPELQVISVWHELVHFFAIQLLSPCICLALAAALLCSNRSFGSAEGVQEQGKQK